jgi:hypothetical protein
VDWTSTADDVTGAVNAFCVFGGSSLGDFARSGRVKDMGLENLIDRQILTRSKRPEDFYELSGRVLEGPELVHSSDMKSAKYEDDWGGVEEVVLEYRKYSRELIRASYFGLLEFDWLREPIRNLAWLLHKASLTIVQDDDQSPTSNQLSIYSLQCLGYIDQPEHHHTIFIYQLPRLRGWPISPKFVTLHDWINTTDPQGQYAMSKPSLGNRFFLAYTLCLTLLNIHCSGWVHKNISSRGILIFPSTRSLSQERIPCLVPYLMS